MRLRSGFAAALLTLLLAVGWSAAVCEMSCVLPQNGHGCCATPIDNGTPSLARPQACPHTARPIAAPPVLPIATAVLAVEAIADAPVLTVLPTVLPVAVESASPPKFNLRI